MFGLFGSKTKLPQVTDKVWMSDEAKLNGFIADIASAHGKNKKIWTLFFFEETAQSTKNSFEKNNISYLEIVNEQFSEHGSGASIVTASAFELLTSATIQKVLKKFLEEGNCEIIMPEHYPLDKEEKRVLEKITSLTNKKVHICFYVSLTEPLMKSFGSEKTISLMTHMGLKEDEMIEHKMVSSAIKNAQKKLDKKVVREKRAASQQEWFSFNIKQHE